MATWYNLTFAYKEILTSAKMTQLDGNLDAIAEGSAGAPNLQTNAIADEAVTWNKLELVAKNKLIAFALSG